MPEFSNFLKTALKEAQNFCSSRGLEEIESVVVLRRMIDESYKEDFANNGIMLLSEIGGSLPLIRVHLDTHISMMGDEIPTKTTAILSGDLERIVKQAKNSSSFKEIGGAEFLMVALKDGKNGIAQVLQNFDITYDKFYLKYSEHIHANPMATYEMQEEKEARIPNIQTYSKNLNDEAFNNRLPPVSGRDNEVDDVIKTLCRRTKNNPVLVGKSGCGKTSVIENLAQKIVAKQVPDNILSKKIYQLDLTSLMAGTRFRGDFEKRIQGIITEAEANPDIILFIDEIHTIMGTGTNSEDGLDLGNILKPALARGKISLIGATTPEEFDRTIDRNAAMRRRFHKITIEEPDEKSLNTIIKTVLDYSSVYYKIEYDDNITPKLLIELSQYINTSANPDKSIEIIDVAFSNVFFEIASTKNVRKLNRRDIISAASNISKIPIGFFDAASDSECLSEAQKFFASKIIHQDDAIYRLINILAMSKVRTLDPTRPKCVEYFDGPEGVGKTELAYLFAEIVLGDREKAFRLDLSQYKTEMALTKLSGAPAGYKGYDDSNMDLLSHIRQNNSCVIILDEIDSCDQSVLDFFISMFERGYVEDNRGRRVNLNNCYFFLTGNVSSYILRNGTKRGMGFQVEDPDLNNAALKAIENRFSNKFLDRIDHITIFNQLNENDLRQILDIELTKMNAYLKSSKVILTDNAKSKLLENLDKNKGARPLRRKITDVIKPIVSEALLLHQKDMVIQIGYDDGYTWKDIHGTNKKHNIEATASN